MKRAVQLVRLLASLALLAAGHKLDDILLHALPVKPASEELERLVHPEVVFIMPLCSHESTPVNWCTQSPSQPLTFFNI
ncbi:MAG: hypothetical protein ACK53Y_10630 [bacterium]